MATYAPPTDDMALLLRVFDFDRQIGELPGYEDVNAELATAVLEEAGRFCAGVIEPLNRSGDEEGCRLQNGAVATPKGFAEAYAAFVAAGWGGLSGDPEFGGQGLPHVLQLLLDEMLSSANLSFGLFPGLTRGAVAAIARHADAGLKAAYLPKMISGEWTGAMALTEPSAGSDLGLLTTRAQPDDDGAFRITGTKIFISSGDHDFGGNVIHLVLARLPDAPKGVKGISLFLAPKFLLNGEGGLGDRNGFSVGALERKMGIHAQPTCVMNYDGAKAWLVGEPGRGLNAMFTMMNAERLFVGVQGLGVAEAAVQRASTYARERLQGRSADGTRGPVQLIEHPDVRKMLLTGRAFTEAGRALAVWTALQLDRSDRHPDRAARDHADGFVALLTPVIKSSFTDLGFETAVVSQQVFGGHGYVREWGMEQFVRDARITQIYEGANGIQAIDLVSRKLPMEGGDLPHRFFALVRQELDASAADPALVAPVAEALARLEAVTRLLQENASVAHESGAAATDYLRLFALVVLGWMWVRMAAGAGEADGRKVRIARFFVDRLLPQTLGLEASIRNGAASIMALDDAEF
ncbi:acyl-CoA dehydrogenase C-terminal domain-containing protein [Methylopila sp. M107]|uniref:acyl-CoA dehydrogenase C-terminal domain-containing protein n=1 Tax=Methylopila sp. M107 TaxID=1101190 RepID=UPI00036B1006|nr:acyl-CoA dehydrogenase C-terminal domain-containing protein [Methylopila sp. M107]